MINKLPKTPSDQSNWDEERDVSLEYVALSADEAQSWRKRHTQMNIWNVLGIQAVVGLCATVGSYLVQISFGLTQVWSSTLYGALVVLLPGALFARGLGSKFGGASVGASVLKFFVWESVKIAVSIAMLMTANRWIGGVLSWPALLFGLIVTFKGFWGFVVWSNVMRASPKNNNSNIYR
jgi:ATP synthase protein I